MRRLKLITTRVKSLVRFITIKIRTHVNVIQWLSWLCRLFMIRVVCVRSSVPPNIPFPSAPQMQ